MIEAHLSAIEKLRQTRERSAAVTLRQSSTLRDSADTAAKSFEEQLRSKAAFQLAAEQVLYQETVTKTLGPQDIEKVYSQIKRESSEILGLQQECTRLKKVAVEAASAAEEARAKYARLLRAHKKWLKVREHHQEKIRIEQAYREEIALEDIMVPGIYG